MCAHVREGSATGVEVRREVLECCRANAILEVIGHSRCLVRWLREVVAEAARAGDPGYFRLNRLRTSNSGDEGGGAWKLRRELRRLLAVIGLAGRANAGIAG